LANILTIGVRLGLLCVGMTAHRLSTVVSCDMIHVFDKGKVLESGTHDELMARRGLYFAMVRAQANPL